VTDQAQAVADRRVHPGTIGLRFLKDLPQTLIGLPALFSVMADTGWQYVIPLAAGAATILALVQWIAWRRFRYGVGTSEIVIESGLLSRNRRSIPFDRIQDIDIERGPLHRLFGLAKVKIETGAGGKAEGVLDSVTLDEADRLRRSIRAGKSGVAESTDGAETAPALAEPAGRPIFTMDPIRVLASGLFNFSLIWVAGLFGLLQTFEPLIPFDIKDPGRLLGLVEENGNRFTLGAIAAVLLLALALGVVSGIVRTTLGDWGFRLLAEGKRLRRERGLLTRSEVVIPKRRVQLALFRTGPLRKALGLGELLVQTLGSGQGQSGLQSVAPFATGAEVDRVMAEFPRLHLPDGETLTRVSSRHVLRVAIRTVTLPLIVIAVASTQRPEAVAFVPLLPLLLAGAVLRRRFHRYGVSGNLLFVQAGFWKRQLWALPMANAQSVSLSRSWLQRRLSLATLAIDTAGAPGFGGPRIVDLPVERARELSALILAQSSRDTASAKRAGDPGS
jgi:putative membrane protein